MKRAVCTAGALMLLVAPVTALADEEPEDGADEQTERAFRIADDRITESSGLAVSSLHEGVVYTHNDSGHEAVVYAVDDSGEVVASLELGEVDAVDWESISAGPDDRIWVGDIGDNGADRDEITLYRFFEPESLEDQGVMWSRYTFEYEDGPQDAEALLVHPETAQVYIATKHMDGGAIYEAPAELSEDSVNTLTKVADVPGLVTAGDFLPDGSRIVLRNYLKGFVFDYPSWDEAGELPMPLQPQGESLAVTPEQDAVLVGSEGQNSWVYRVPLSALAENVEPATPSPNPDEDEETAADEGQGEADGGDDNAGPIATVESWLGGVPWWLPTVALALAILAGVAAYPRPRQSGPQETRAGSGASPTGRPPRSAPTEHGHAGRPPET